MTQEARSQLGWLRAVTILLGLLLLTIWIGIGVTVITVRNLQKSLQTETASTLKDLQTQKIQLGKRLNTQTKETLAGIQALRKQREALPGIPANPLAKIDYGIRLSELLGEENELTIIHLLETQLEVSRALSVPKSK